MNAGDFSGTKRGAPRLIWRQARRKIISPITLIVYFIVGAACALGAERLVPNTIPGGFRSSAAIGVLGAWVGVSLFGAFGPSLAGMPLLPAIVGAVVWVFLLWLITGRKSKAWRT